MSLDKKFLQKRQNMYNREDVFISMFLKHSAGKCSCKKTGKICISNFSELDLQSILNISQFKNKSYIKNNMKYLEAYYTVCQSITQSLRCRAGKEFENVLEEVLNEEKFIKNKHYMREVFLSNEGVLYIQKPKNTIGGHYIDYIFPAIFQDCKIEDFDGEIVSCKTKLRERYRQDYIHNRKITLISLEKCSDTQYNSICITHDGNALTKWIKKMKINYIV